MPKPRQTGQIGEGGQNLRRIRGRGFFAAALAFGLLALAGCHPGNRATNTDPLLGPGAAPPNQTAGVPSNNAPRSNTTIPAGLGSPTPAALAAGTPPRMDGGQSLSISDSNHTATAGWQAQGQGGVQLRTPEGGPPSPAPPAPPPVGAQPAAGGTIELAQAQLAQRGVTWQRLEQWADKGEWKFTCSVPVGPDGRKSRTYEARARDPLAAMRAVLDKIDQNRPN